MHSIVSRLAASALIVAFSLVAAPGAMAQQTRDPLLPSADKLRPWEKKLERFYSRGNPQSEVDKATKRLYSDPLQKFGLPENKPLLPSETPQPEVTAPTLQPGVVELDRNSTGSITRDEYFRGRIGVMTLQERVSSRGRRMINRLNSQFRRADRNGDGIVTPLELQQGGGRF